MEHSKVIKFKEYEQIYGTHAPEGASIIEKFTTIPELKNVQWISSEKIHGCNFSFISDGTVVRCAKRHSVLNEKESFNNFELIFNRYGKNVLEVFQFLKNENPQLELVRIFGQFYGGIYEGFNNPKIRPIFTEVKYSPDLEFEAFDITIKTSGKDSQVYLNYYQVIELMKKFGIPYAEVLVKGTLSEVLPAIDVEQMESGIYKKNKGGVLPQIPDNFAQGVVLKTVDNLRDAETGVRYVLKLKSQKFFEAVYTPKEQIKKSEQIIENHEEISNWLIENSGTYINKNRLETVLSKLSDHEQTSRIIKSKLVQDALKDFEDQFSGEEFKVQQKLIHVNKQKIVQKISTEIAKLLLQFPPQIETIQKKELDLN